jgi:L-aspartate oxidase
VYDVLVLGSGVAGLTTALHAARRGLTVLVLTKGELSHSATRYAQGGVAAALAAPDTPDLHLDDTLTAGAGLCDTDAVRILVTEGPDRVRELAQLGAHFDTEPSPDGPELLLAREGGHSVARVVHAGGDATGAEIARALSLAAEPRIRRVEAYAFALAVAPDGGACSGVWAMGDEGVVLVNAGATMLALGGAGALFESTTNNPASTGDSLSMAYEVGVRLSDLEFIQFHPTALAVARRASKRHGVAPPTRFRRRAQLRQLPKPVDPGTTGIGDTPLFLTKMGTGIRPPDTCPHLCKKKGSSRIRVGHPPVRRCVKDLSDKGFRECLPA